MYRVKGRAGLFHPMHVKSMERGWKPHVEISPACPRCGSLNTKFCYYNNYSLTQPRYFCKGCRRYWTKGGSLRNVPVGGGCRKTRRGTKHNLRDVLPVTIPIRGGAGSAAAMAATALGLSCMNTPTLSPPSNGCSSLTTADHQAGLNHIDLALVYANFLNQKPSSSDHQSAVDQAQNSPLHHHHQIEIPMLPPLSFQFQTPLSTQEIFIDFADHQCRPLSFESPETQFTSNGFYFSGLESIGKQTEYNGLISSNTMENHQASINYSLLPPLPGEELNHNPVVSQGLGWSTGSNELILPSQTIHANQISAGFEEQSLPQNSAATEAPKQQLDENVSHVMNAPIELCNVLRP